MGAFLITLLVLVLALLWLRAWVRHSRLALGIVLGMLLTVTGYLLFTSLVHMTHMPLWLPALPFAIVALTLFGFGLLAWIWAED